MTPQMIDRLWQAFLDTGLMVGVSAGIAVLAGLPLALFLVISGPGGIVPAPAANRVVGAVVNGFRAVPFIVLLVAQGIFEGSCTLTDTIARHRAT